MSVTVSTTSNSVTVTDQAALQGATASGTVATQLNYVNNNAVNIIQGAGTDANVWGNTISGGGNSAQPNLIRGSTSLRTIAGGYDNIIGRDATAFPSDGTATIQSQILCGAHNRIFLNGDTNFPAGLEIPVNNGVTQPTHSTIAGGSYHQIRNGDYGFIGGGTNCVIQEKAGSEAYADGQGAFIGGGFKNIAYGKQCVIAGGNTNVNECQNSAIGGGVINSILTPKDSGGNAKTSSVIAGGSNNTINCAGAAAIVGGELNKIAATSGTTDLGLYSFIGGGYNNQIATTLYSPYSVICGGFQNTVNNQFSAVVGGRANLVSSLYCTAIGFQSNARNYGGFVHGGEAFSSAGDAQSSVYVLKCETTTTVQKEMLSMGQSLTVPSDTSWAFRALVVARHGSSNSSAGYEVKGLIHNDSGTAAIVGTVSTTVLGESSTPTSMTGCDATAEASGATLRVMVTGLSTSVKWVARLEITEVTA